MEREVGGGIGMGNTCKPLAVSFQCMTKSTINKKKMVKKINKREMLKGILWLITENVWKSKSVARSSLVTDSAGISACPCWYTGSPQMPQVDPSSA